MLRFVLLVLLRSLLVFAALYVVYKLLSSTARAFFEGLRGSGDVQPPPQKRKSKKPYSDVQDAEFKDLNKP